MSFVLSNNGTFVHFVYSKLRWNDNAIVNISSLVFAMQIQAGFNTADRQPTQFKLPGSGTTDAVRLANNSDIGIPGEWLFRIDTPQVHQRNCPHHPFRCTCAAPATRA